MSTPPANNVPPALSSHQQRQPAQVSDDERIAQMVWMRMQLEMNFNRGSRNSTSISEQR